MILLPDLGEFVWNLVTKLLKSGHSRYFEAAGFYSEDKVELAELAKEKRILDEVRMSSIIPPPQNAHRSAQQSQISYRSTQQHQSSYRSVQQQQSSYRSTGPRQQPQVYQQQIIPETVLYHQQQQAQQATAIAQCQQQNNNNSCRPKYGLLI